MKLCIISIARLRTFVAGVARLRIFVAGVARLRTFIAGAVRLRLSTATALLALLVAQCSSQSHGAEPPAQALAREHLVLVVGAGGTAQYASEFADWSAAWRALAQHRNWQLTLIDEDLAPGQTLMPGDTTSRDQLQAAIEEHATSDGRLWIVMLGHGTAVGDNAKFNLPGADVSSREMAIWLDPLSCPIVVINCSSASGPFLPALSKPGRIVVTATRSGSEFNYSRFGAYLSESLQDLSADLDHDLEISLLEAFLTAVARTEQFYRGEARLATEHALIDDNGDGRGTSGEFFHGLRTVQVAEAGEPVDGQAAARVMLFASLQALQLTPAQRAQREAVETRIDALRERKQGMQESHYYDQLEALLLELAIIYEAAEM